MSVVTVLCLLLISPIKAELHFQFTTGSPPPREILAERDTAEVPRLNLSGDWRYQAGNQSGTVAVPCCYSGYEGTVTFTRSINIPSDWQGRDIALRFSGISHRASVHLNGVLIGSCQSRVLPFEMLIPNSVIQFGSSNELTIAVDNRLLPYAALPLRSSLFAPRNYGGITGDISLLALPPERLRTLEIKASIPQKRAYNAKTTRPATLTLSFQLQLNHSAENTRLIIEIFDQKNTRILRQSLPVEQLERDRSGNATHTITWQQAHLWRPDDPYLYRLSATLRRGAERLDRITRHFGVQEPFVMPTSTGHSDKAKIYQGVTYIPQWFQSGITATKQQLLRDALAMKDLDVDFIHCAYYFPPPYFFDLCDSLGVELWLDIPLYGVSETLLKRADVQDAAFDAMVELRNTAARHPSVVACGWGSNLDPNALSRGDFLQIMSDRLPSTLPYYAHTPPTNGIPEAVTLYFPPFDDADLRIMKIPVLTLRFADLPDKRTDLRRTGQLKSELKAINTEQSGFIINYLNDWYSDRVMISIPPSRNPYLHRQGLWDVRHQPRPVYFQLQNFLRSGDLETMSTSPNATVEPPWQFLTLGIFLTGLLLWLLRADKLFRQNLRRSLGHLSRLIVDIRDRRFLQASHTLLLFLFIGLGWGNLAASQIYYWRETPGFNALMNHLCGFDAVLNAFRIAAWNPYFGILFFSSGTMLTAFIVMLIVKWGRSRRNGSLSFIQAFYILTWPSVPVLAIVPFSAFYLRFKEVPWLAETIIIGTAVALFWCYLRLLKTVIIAYHGSILRALAVCLGLPLLFISMYIIHLQTARQTLDYIGYFCRLFTS